MASSLRHDYKKESPENVKEKLLELNSSWLVGRCEQMNVKCATKNGDPVKRGEVYLVKDGHVAADKTVSHNFRNSSSLILIISNAFQTVTEYDGAGHFDGTWSFGATLIAGGDVVVLEKSHEDEDKDDDLENLHWHADVKELTVVALICIVPEITS